MLEKTSEHMLECINILYVLCHMRLARSHVIMYRAYVRVYGIIDHMPEDVSDKMDTKWQE